MRLPMTLLEENGENMEKFKEKDFYKQKIIEMVEKINNQDILEYLYIFIKGKTERHTNDEDE